MAEAVAVLGLVSSILQVVDYGTKVISRLNDFRTSIDEAPKAFRDILVELPLLVNTLDRTRQQAESGAVDRSVQEALLPVVEGCLSQITALYDILGKVIPKKPESSLQRSIKAIKSVGYEKRVEQITSTLQKYIQTLTYHQVVIGISEVFVVASREPFFGVPFDRDRNFIGRVSILHQVEASIADHRHVALAGIGGVGKSQIAIEAGYRYRITQPAGHVLWVHASTVDRFDQAYKDIFRRLVGASGRNSADLFSREAVCDWLSENGPWLLIIDNADDLDILFSTTAEDKPLISFIPHHPAGSLLITTRNKRVGERMVGRENCIAISSPNDMEAEGLLRSKIASETWNPRAAKTLVGTLTNLPLAISQAAAFISENNLTLEEYLEVLSVDDSELMDFLSQDSGDVRRDFQIGNSVAKTWKLSFDQINRQKPRAAEIMSLMAVLDRQGVPRSLLERAEERKSDFITAIGTLQAFSLISTEKGDSTTYGQLVRMAEIRFESPAMKFPEASFEHWPECEALYPHARLISEIFFEDDISRVNHAFLLDLMVEYELQIGNLQIARTHQEKACKALAQILGENDISTLEARARLAEVMREQGSPASTTLFRELVGPIEAALGPDAENTLVVKINLALFLKDGEEDEILLLEVLKRLEETGRTNSFTYLLALDNLGVVNRNKGRRDDSIAFHKKALAGKEALLGPDHQSTLISSYNLEIALDETDKPERQWKTLAKQRKVLGDKHPDTLLTLINLSRTLTRNGQYEEAQRLALESVPEMEKLLGTEHPRTLTAINTLAHIYARLKDYPTAKAHYEKVLDLFDKVLGQDDERTRLCWWSYMSLPAEWRTFQLGRTWPADHPVSITVTNEEGIIQYKKGDYQKAKKLHRAALSLQEQRGEGDSLPSLYSKYLLGRTLIELFEYSEAESLLRQALAGRRKNLKENDEGILDTMNVLAIVLWDQGGDKAAEAEDIYRELLSIWDKSSDPLNLGRLTVVSNLGLLEISRKDYHSAEKRYRMLLIDREKVQGAYHRDTLTCMLSLSMVLGYQELYEEAEDLNRKALDGLKLDLGVEHPTTILSQSTLANILTKRGKYDEAETMIRSAIAAREKVLGPDHPFTLKSMGRLSEICELQQRYEEALQIQKTVCELCKHRLGEDHQETLGHDAELLRIESIVATHKDHNKQNGEE